VQKLLTSLAEKQKLARLYDPFCRSGGMLFELGEEIDSPAVLEGVTAELVSYKAAKIYSLMMNRNSSITIESFGQLLDRAKIFDIIITNPPFGHLSGDHSASEKYWSKTFPSKRSEIRYLTHCLDHLSEKGQAYIILPRGFLTWSDRLIVALRKELIERNIIEGVVELPQKVFFGTGTATAVLLLNKQKRSKKIILINAGQFGTKERDRLRFSFETIELIKTWLQKFRKGKISDLPQREVQVFSTKEMMQQDYSLGFKATPNDKRERPSSESLMLECAKSQLEISKIQRLIQELSNRI
jgi:type I restriction enzyme M protein